MMSCSNELLLRCKFAIHVSHGREPVEEGDKRQPSPRRGRLMQTQTAPCPYGSRIMLNAMTLENESARRASVSWGERSHGLAPVATMRKSKQGVLQERLGDPTRHASHPESATLIRHVLNQASFWTFCFSSQAKTASGEMRWP